MLFQTSCVITVLFSLQSCGSIQWPAETYGIPKPKAGCPQAVGFRWQTGWRLQRDAWHYQHIGSQSNNSRSLEFHIDGKVDRFTVNKSFCMKEDTRTDFMRPTWPRGKYCIYKGNDACPKDLTPGWVFWEDSYDNDEKDGTLPDGVSWKFTEIHFCCRTDGDKDVPILLPSKSPFFLLAYGSAKCQMVKWAVASVEWIYYYTHNKEDDQRNGAYPYNAGKMHPTIYYCYYRGCKNTLTDVTGTFKSPNYPKRYPNGQYCSWKIIVNITQQIHIVFQNFSLQIERFTDELRVYDGEDEMGEVLGVFYGGHPPPKEGIYSSSSRMFLKFKSDKTDSYTGFSASYFAVRRVTTTKAPTPAARMTSPHFLISKTSIASKVTSSPTVTSSITVQEASSPVVPTTSSTQGTLIRTTTRGKLWSSTTEVPPKIGGIWTKSAIATSQPSKESGKKEEQKQPHRKGLNVVAVVIPVVSAILIAALVVAGICFIRKRRKRVEEPDDEIYLRLSSEPPVSHESTDL